MVFGSAALNMTCIIFGSAAILNQLSISEASPIVSIALMKFGFVITRIIGSTTLGSPIDIIACMARGSVIIVA